GGNTAQVGISFMTLGVIYRMNPDGTGFTVMHLFDGLYGARPGDGLVAMDGALYGTTSMGGIGNPYASPSLGGTVYKITPDGTFTDLHDFTGADGFTPVYSLTPVGGVLYGTTRNGGGSPIPGGTFFRLNPDGSRFALLRVF